MNTEIWTLDLPVGPSAALGDAGLTDPRTGQKRAWQRYVDQRRGHLHDAYPCAMPTNRRRCPKHGLLIGVVSGLCKPCRDELYEQLANDYINSNSKEDSMTEDVEIYEPLNLEDQQSATAPVSPTGLFGTDNPSLVVERAAVVANELARVIRAQKLSIRISGREHVLVEGWTLLGTMLGVFPVLTWTRHLEDGWEARVEARTLTGAVVGAAESECLRSERRWASADDYAIRSMAATRATSKALRQPLGFVMQLAGFEATPAEEIPADDSSGDRPTDAVAAAGRASQDQLTRIAVLLADLARHDPGIDWRAKARDLAGVPADAVTESVADNVIRSLEAEAAEIAARC
jgi:hypothetical protein